MAWTVCHPSLTEQKQGNTFEAGCGNKDHDKESTNVPNLNKIKIGKSYIFKGKGYSYGFPLREKVWIFFSAYPEYHCKHIGLLLKNVDIDILSA